MQFGVSGKIFKIFWPVGSDFLFLESAICSQILTMTCAIRNENEMTKIPLFRILSMQSANGFVWKLVPPFFPYSGYFSHFHVPHTHIVSYIYMHTHIIYTHCAYLSHIFFHFISSYYIPIKPWDSLVKFSCFMVQPRCFTTFAVSAPVKPTIFLIKPDKATMFNGEPPCFTVSNLQQNKLPLQKSGAVALLLVFAWMAQWPPRRRNAWRIFCWFDIYY